MHRPSVRKLVSSEATEEELRHICNGTLEQVQAIALVRAFDPGAWIRISTVMEHLSTFMRTNFEIDVPPDYLSVHLPHDVPLPGHYSLLELTFLCDILDGDLMAFREQRTLLLLRVTTTIPVSTLTSNGVSCLS